MTNAPNIYKFTGKERDSESGLDNFGARYNASTLGRFMSPDPKQIGAHLFDPQTLNRYAYTRNNPLAYIDPDGKDLEKAWSLAKTFFKSISVKVSVGAGIGEKWKVGRGESKVELTGKYSLEFGGQGVAGDKIMQTSRSVEVGVTSGIVGGPKVGEGISVSQVTSTVYKDVGPKGEEPPTKEITDSIGGHSTAVTSSGDTVGIGGEVAVGFALGVEVNSNTQGLSAGKDAVVELKDSLKNPGPPVTPPPPLPPPCAADKEKKCSQ